MMTKRMIKNATLSVLTGTSCLFVLSPLAMASTTSSANTNSAITSNAKMISSADAPTVSLSEFQMLLNQHGQQVQSPAFQAELTQMWESSHQVSTMSSNSTTSPNLSTSPNSVPIPVGASEVTTTYDNDPGQYDDTSNSFWSSYTESTTEGWVFTATVHAVELSGKVADFVVSAVTNLMGSFINIQKQQPVYTQYWHSFRYGWKDVYFWTGSSWEDVYTTSDREWYGHVLVSWTNDQNLTSSESTDYNSAPFAIDYASTWNETDAQLESLGENYYVSNQHGYAYYPGY